MKMNLPETDRVTGESDDLRRALDAETGRASDLQRQLDQANREFEEFVSTLAHDVREPLREITAFSQLLAETSAASPDPATAEFLAHIRQGAARIESLSAAVVDYWSGPGESKHCRVDMEAVLSHALLVKAKILAASNATVTHDPLPAVTGDFELLTKVLRHLIRNALEYSESPTPSVHVSCERVDATWRFSVADNGPGIDAAFHERIFGTFKRLHGREHPGHGLGLAFCRKAIGWHGGRIWVESISDSGSTFYFTLPPAA